MTFGRFATCDTCGTTAPTANWQGDYSSIPEWLSARPIGWYAAFYRAERLSSVREPKVWDFCSLRCLSAWPGVPLLLEPAP